MSSSQSFSTHLDLSTIDSASRHLSGPGRIVNHGGRSGLNATSIHSRIKIDSHTLAGNQGSAIIWFMPLEDMNSTHALNGFDLHHKLWHTFPLLTDSPDFSNEDASRFMLAWNVLPHPAFYARFYSGNYHKDVFQPIQKAFTRANGTSFRALHWYQIILSWNHETQDYVIFVNGFKATDMNQFREPGVPREIYREVPGDTLYTGSPSYAVSEVAFYEKAFTADDAAALYQAEQRSPQPAEDARLAKFYLGLDLPRFDWTPDSAWKTQLSAMGAMHQ